MYNIDTSQQYALGKECRTYLNDEYCTVLSINLLISI